MYMSPPTPTPADSILDTLAEGIFLFNMQIQSHLRAGHWIALAFRLKPTVLIEAPQSQLKPCIPMLHVLWPDQSYLNPLDIPCFFPAQGFAHIGSSD